MPTRLVLLVFVVVVAAAVAGLIGGNSVNSPSAPDVETAGKQIVAAGENVIEKVGQGPTPALPTGGLSPGDQNLVGTEGISSHLGTMQVEVFNYTTQQMQLESVDLWQARIADYTVEIWEKNAVDGGVIVQYNPTTNEVIVRAWGSGFPPQDSPDRSLKSFDWSSTRSLTPPTPNITDVDIMRDELVALAIGYDQWKTSNNVDFMYTAAMQGVLNALAQTDGYPAYILQESKKPLPPTTSP